MKHRRRKMDGDGDGGRREETQERPKWEELNLDCLVNIFSRLNMEDLLLDVPYVCKSWYKATCNPQCWATLNFTKILVDEQHEYNRAERLADEYGLYMADLPQRLPDEYKLAERLADEYKLYMYMGDFLANEVGKYRPYNHSAVTSFIKYVVKRSNGLATFVKLPSCCTEEAIVFVSNECPNLKTLMLSLYMHHFPASLFPSLVTKWKRLEKLCLSWRSNTKEILSQIGIHCNNFEALEISEGQIEEEEASALGTFLPNIKVLSIRYAHISKENLLVILNCCKKLEVLDARDCVGFDEGDDDILKSAAHIPRAKFEGSTWKGDEDYGGYCDCCGVSSDDEPNYQNMDYDDFLFQL